MNTELLKKLFETSTGLSFPSRSTHYEYRSLSASNLHNFAKAIIEECGNFTDKELMKKHFDIM